MKRMIAPLLAVALAGCGRSEEEFKALESRLQQTQSSAVQAQAKAKQDFDAAAEKAKAAQAAADQARAAAEQKAEATAKDLARTNDELKAAQAAQSAVQKERDGMKAEVARMEKAVEEAKGNAEAAKQLQELQAKMAAKEQELAQAKAATEAALANAHKMEEEVSRIHRTEALGTRLGYKGKETIAPYLVLPLTFNAKKGETLSWSWSVAEAPKDLTADALDFAVVGPDQVKAHGLRAGWQKKDDKGSVTAPADGRWTVVWSNRHPAAAFTVEFEASLKPVQ